MNRLCFALLFVYIVFSFIYLCILSEIEEGWSYFQNPSFETYYSAHFPHFFKLAWIETAHGTVFKLGDWAAFKNKIVRFHVISLCSLPQLAFFG